MTTEESVTTWHAEVTDKGALITAAAANPSLHVLLEVNQKYLNMLARRDKAAMAIPGVRALSQTNVAARSR